MTFRLKTTVDVSEVIKFQTLHRGSSTLIRSSEMLIKEGTETLIEAVEGIVWSPCNNNDEMFYAYDKMKMRTPIKKIPDNVKKDKIVKLLEDNFNEALVAFIGWKGSFSKKRFWILLSDDKVDGEYIYVGMPDLVDPGKNGKISSAICESLSSYLDAGGESSMIEFIKSSGFVVDPAKIRFCFKKGLHVKGFVWDYKKFQKDMNTIFTSMKPGAGPDPLMKFEWVNTSGDELSEQELKALRKGTKNAGPDGKKIPTEEDKRKTMCLALSLFAFTALNGQQEPLGQYRINVFENMSGKNDEASIVVRAVLNGGNTIINFPYAPSQIGFLKLRPGCFVKETGGIFKDENNLILEGGNALHVRYTKFPVRINANISGTHLDPDVIDIYEGLIKGNVTYEGMEIHKEFFVKLGMPLLGPVFE